MLKLNSKGQSAMELLILVSFFLLFSTPLLSLLYLQASERVQDSALMQAKQACTEIVEAADSVYVQGNETSERITVVFPQGLHGIRADGRELTFTVQTSGGKSDVSVVGLARIEIGGRVDYTAGPHRLMVRSAGDRVIVLEG